VIPDFFFIFFMNGNTLCKVNPYRIRKKQKSNSFLELDNIDLL